MHLTFSRPWIRLAVAACALLMTNATDAAEPLKVFLLAGQSNMVGHARAHTIATLSASDSARDQELVSMVFGNDGAVSRKTLEAQLAHGQKLDELTGGISNDKIKNMKDGPEKKALEAQVMQMKAAHEAYKKQVAGACKISDRVYINSIADGNRRSGKLGVGYGGSRDKIGPEYGFGLSIAEQIDGPILLIKTSWGGKSLNYNFRPPSTGDYTLNDKEKASDKADEIKKNAGLNYRMMNEAIRNVLDNLKDNHPAYDADAGYEIAGFVWFQGWNDMFNKDALAEYEQNLVHLVKDVRRELKSPKLRVVIGELGNGGPKAGANMLTIRTAQKAAAERKEFAGTVKFASTTAFARPKEESPNVGHGHHWFGNVESYFLIGDALGRAMVELLD